jgi:eukaryotic translation initiation factor 2-alpha kinase 4
MYSSAKPDSPHRQAVLAALFNQTSRGVRGYLYDNDVEHPEHASLNGIVRDTLSTIFRLHGAIEMAPPLLMPATDSDDDTTRVLFVDRHGEVVGLPNNALLPFARIAARNNLKRIKRFHIGDIYRPK